MLGKKNEDYKFLSVTIILSPMAEYISISY